METTITAFRPKLPSLSKKQQSASFPVVNWEQSSYYRNAAAAYLSELPATVVFQNNRLQLPSVSVNLKWLFEDLEGMQKVMVLSANSHPDLDYLAVSVDSFGQHWITVQGTDKSLISKPFAQPEYCYEAALELEETFDRQVVELRSPETMERIQEIVGFYWEREQGLLVGE